MDTATRQIDAGSRHMQWHERQLRRKYTRGLGHKATGEQAEAVRRAARWRALADAALTDPTCTHNDRVRLEYAADKAERKMRDLLATKPSLPSLSQLMRVRA